MYKDVKFCVRHDESKVSDVITQMGGMRQDVVSVYISLTDP